LLAFVVTMFALYGLGMMLSSVFPDVGPASVAGVLALQSGLLPDGLNFPLSSCSTRWAG